MGLPDRSKRMSRSRSSRRLMCSTSVGRTESDTHRGPLFFGLADLLENMPPKTPDKLKEQLERQNEQPAEKGKSKSAEGMEVLTPTRGDFNSRDSHFGTQCSGTKSCFPCR